jgi:hypothetical protein
MQAIMQNEIRSEKVKAMTDAAREFGHLFRRADGGDILRGGRRGHRRTTRRSTPDPRAPGIVRRGTTRLVLPAVTGDPDLVRGSGTSGRAWATCSLAGALSF